jgi:hypothetical protein
MPVDITVLSFFMRTTLDLPAELVEEARHALGYVSKTDTIVFALKEVVRRSRIDELKDLIGRIEFEFDPTELRDRERRRVR